MICGIFGIGVIAGLGAVLTTKNALTFVALAVVIIIGMSRLVCLISASTLVPVLVLIAFPSCAVIMR